MSGPDENSINRLIEKEMEDHNTFPGAELLVTNSQQTLKRDSYGLAEEVPEKRSMEDNTLFDLASLTKVVATSTAAVALLEEGLWQLNDKVTEYQPRLENREFTIKQLLTHQSGLPPWVDLFSNSSSREEALDRLYTEDWPVSDTVVPPGERVIYSDIGFILLGQAIEEVTGSSLADYTDRRIFDPLEMEATGFRPPEGIERPVAATEKVEDRGGVLRGEVHDENAHSLGGVAGHAGLFSTAGDLGIFARALLGGGSTGSRRVLSERSVQIMTSPQTEEGNQARGLGWKLQGDHSPEAGDLFSKRAYGHTGFTGGSVWIDPESDLGVVFLTNRVHPDRSRGEGRIHRIRGLVHNCVSAVFGS